MYGGAKQGSRVGATTEFKRHALHAMYLGFEHPRTGERMVFQAAPPADFMEFLAARGADGVSLRIAGLAEGELR